jgi:hypothetical protein
MGKGKYLDLACLHPLNQLHGWLSEEISDLEKLLLDCLNNETSSLSLRRQNQRRGLDSKILSQCLKRLFNPIESLSNILHGGCIRKSLKWICSKFNPWDHCYLGHIQEIISKGC